MKKLFAVIFCVILISGGILTASAQTQLAGTTWELVAYYEGSDQYEVNPSVLYLGTDGSAVLAGSDATLQGWYEQSGDNVVIEFEEGVLRGYLENGALYLQDGPGVLVFQQSGSQQPGGQQPGGQQPGNDGQKPGGMQGIIDYLKKNWWLPVGVVAGTIIGISIRKNRKPASPEAPPVYPPAYPPAPIPATVAVQQPVYGAPSSLICTKGHYAGATFPINGCLSIGRDPKRCQLVFPSETGGISSLHCEVRQQAHGVTVTDMGSTYGTFVMGRKLNVHESVTLNPGDSFHLADAKNEFKVL